MKAQTLVTDVGGDSYLKYGKELTEEYKDNTLVDPHGKNGKGVGEVVCHKCLHRGGTLLYCCGYWHCICCNEEKIKLGVHSVSKGVESIFDSQEVVSKDEVIEREYFVKYQGLAHAHNCWIPEKQMLVEAPKLLEKYKKKQQVVSFAIAWSNLAGLFMESGDFNRALQYYKETVKLKPSFPDAYLDLGNVYKALGMPQEAIACYQHALQTRPNYGMAYGNLANEKEIKTATGSMRRPK
ncbi:hypothetical protein RYX36_036035 [Vicia faba]